MLYACRVVTENYVKDGERNLKNWDEPLESAAQTADKMMDEAPQGRTDRYSAASPVIGDGFQRRTGLRAAAVSSRRRRGVSVGAAWK